MIEMRSGRTVHQPLVPVRDKLLPSGCSLSALARYTRRSNMSQNFRYYWRPYRLVCFFPIVAGLTVLSCRTQLWHSKLFTRSAGKERRQIPPSPLRKGKGKVYPVTGHKGPRGRVELLLYPFFNLCDRWGGWSTLRITPRKEARYPLYRRLGGPQGRC
jgi:hypothetical protein